LDISEYYLIAIISGSMCGIVIAQILEYWIDGLIKKRRRNRAEALPPIDIRNYTLPISQGYGNKTNSESQKSNLF